MGSSLSLHTVHTSLYSTGATRITVVSVSRYPDAQPFFRIMMNIVLKEACFHALDTEPRRGKRYLPSIALPFPAQPFHVYINILIQHTHLPIHQRGSPVFERGVTNPKAPPPGGFPGDASLFFGCKGRLSGPPLWLSSDTAYIRTSSVRKYTKIYNTVKQSKAQVYLDDRYLLCLDIIRKASPLHRKQEGRGQVTMKGMV